MRSDERLISHARSMRHEPTEAERKLWFLVRDRRFSGWKFRRQMPRGPYIVDFICLEARLIVEADGEQHAEDGRDQLRDACLRAEGYRVLRFWNHEIFKEEALVKDVIWAALHGE